MNSSTFARPSSEKVFQGWLLLSIRPVCGHVALALMGSAKPHPFTSARSTPRTGFGKSIKDHERCAQTRGCHLTAPSLHLAQKLCQTLAGCQQPIAIDGNILLYDEL